MRKRGDTRSSLLAPSFPGSADARSSGRPQTAEVPLAPAECPSLTAAERRLDLRTVALGPRALEFLDELVAAPTPSGERDLVIRGQDVLARRLVQSGWQAESGGSALHRVYRFAQKARTGSPRILLVTHIDTVLAPESHVRRRGSVARGPGCADAKGGIAALWCALRAVADAWTGPLPNIRLVVSGDEETGGATSRALLEDLAIWCDAALVFEPAREEPWGALVVARGGAARARLEVLGTAAHSGSDFFRGANAVAELSAKLAILARLSRPERGVVVNPGVAQSGPLGAHNLVPPRARAEFDLRYPDEEARRLLRRSFLATAAAPLAVNPWGPSTACTASFVEHAPPMPLDERRLGFGARILGLARALGVAAAAARVPGASDANTLARAGALVVDGLGPVGGALHTEEEWVDLESLVERARLLALLVARLGCGRLIL